MYGRGGGGEGGEGGGGIQKATYWSQKGNQTTIN